MEPFGFDAFKEEQRSMLIPDAAGLDDVPQNSYAVVDVLDPKFSPELLRDPGERRVQILLEELGNP